MLLWAWNLVDAPPTPQVDTFTEVLRWSLIPIFAVLGLLVLETIRYGTVQRRRKLRDPGGHCRVIDERERVES